MSKFNAALLSGIALESAQRCRQSLVGLAEHAALSRDFALRRQHATRRLIAFGRPDVFIATTLTPVANECFTGIHRTMPWQPQVGSTAVVTVPVIYVEHRDLSRLPSRPIDARLSAAPVRTSSEGVTRCVARLAS